MEDSELEAVADGTRTFTDAEREWAIGHHDFLWEYVATQDKAQRAKLSDHELAAELQSASWDYVRSACM